MLNWPKMVEICQMWPKMIKGRSSKTSQQQQEAVKSEKKNNGLERQRMMVNNGEKAAKKKSKKKRKAKVSKNAKKRQKWLKIFNGAKKCLHRSASICITLQRCLPRGGGQEPALVAHSNFAVFIRLD